MESYTNSLGGIRTYPIELDGSDEPKAIELQDDPPPQTATEVPDGGVKSWLQVAGAFTLFFNTWGLVNSYGVFQTIYETTVLPSESNSRISWIGSTQSSLILFTCIAGGHLYDSGHLHLLLIAGTCFNVFGMMTTSICTKYWQFFLAQGVVVGIGGGFLFIPSVAVIAQYFSKKRAFATGIASLGSGIGGVVFPVIIRQLDSALGFRWAVRVVAFVILGTSAIPLACMRHRYTPVASKKSFSKAICSWPYLSFCFAIFFGYMGTYVVLFYIQLYSIEHTNISHNIGFNSITILNASSILGRVVASYLADKVGPLNISLPCTLCAGLLSFFWIYAGSSSSIVAISVLFGMTSAAFFALPSPTVISLSEDLGSVGLQIGLMECFAGAGLLMGTPVAGALLGNEHWLSIQAFAGALITAAALCILNARIFKVGGRLRAKA